MRRRLLFVLLFLPPGFLVLFLAGVVDFGGQRWPVKTFRDRDRSRVRLAAVDATVTSLTRISRPPDGAFRGRSRIAAEELTVYRVRARLRRADYEPDGDIHMILVDPADPSRTIIAEIPEPLYSLGSGFEGVFRTERAEMKHHLPARGETVEVTGIGFFDCRVHLRFGGASNGFELHPVIGLKFFSDVKGAAELLVPLRVVQTTRHPIRNSQHPTDPDCQPLAESEVMHPRVPLTGSPQPVQKRRTPSRLDHDRESVVLSPVFARAPMIGSYIRR